MLTSIGIANSHLGSTYLDFWHHEIGIEIGDVIDLKYSLEHWINDGLMTIFFLMVGLEIERELYIGELSTIGNAAFPTFAAMGGMIMPALIHFLFNRGTETQAGIAIPMATDNRFCSWRACLIRR